MYFGFQTDDITVEDSTVNGGVDDDSKAETEAVYSVPKSFESIEHVPEDRVLFRASLKQKFILSCF